MKPKWNPRTGRYEILVDTPMGQVWQDANAPRPPMPDNPYARYSPTGRQPSAYYGSPSSATQKQHENLFDAEFASLMGEAFKDPTKPIMSSIKKGGGRKKRPEKNFPTYLTPLHLKRLGGGR